MYGLILPQMFESLLLVVLNSCSIIFCNLIRCYVSWAAQAIALSVLSSLVALPINYTGPLALSVAKPRHAHMHLSLQTDGKGDGIGDRAAGRYKLKPSLLPFAGTPRVWFWNFPEASATSAAAGSLCLQTAHSNNKARMPWNVISCHCLWDFSPLDAQKEI